MSDIVERLRHLPRESVLAHEAAAEIERLRKALGSIAFIDWCEDGTVSGAELLIVAQKIAKDALAPARDGERGE
jgi:hypothetical protein